ncbi:MAG: ABC transporter substrate-binding protein [Actinomycetota bacterium]|nr:ABC transporter substrate-binding protein [Actinomycetota bacterium]
MRRLILAALVAFLLAATAAAMTPASGSAQATTTVRMAITQNDKNWTPYTYQTGYPGYNVLTLMYDTLLWHDKDNQVIPWLAEEYQFSSDGLTVDLTLRDGVKWHDGRDLTAEDVKFTYDYIQEFNHGRFTPEVKGVLESVTVVAPNKVSMKLLRPSASFATAPLADVTILPKHIWENIREPYPSQKGEQGLAVGSGPYKMAAYDVDKQYRLVANADYFMGKPAVDEIILPIIPDANAQILALRGGEVDAVAPNLPPELVKELSGAPGINVATGPDYTTSAITMNTARAPFDQLGFRQAVGFAIDVEELVRTVLADFGTPGSPGWVHPESPFYKQGLRHGFDSSRANTLLDELGYTNRDDAGTRQSPTGKKLEFQILANSGNPIEVRTAEVIGSMLGRVGIKASVVALTGSAKAARTGGFGGQNADRDFDFNMAGATAPVQDDPDRLRTIFETWNPVSPNLNAGKWSNPDFDAALNAQSRELDPDKRQRFIDQMQDILATQRPSVVLYYRNGAYAHRSGAYDSWVYVRGKGTVDKISFVSASEEGTDGDRAASAGASQDDGGGGGTGAALGAIAGALLVGGGVVFYRSRRRGAEQE